MVLAGGGRSLACLRVVKQRLFVVTSHPALHASYICSRVCLLLPVLKSADRWGTDHNPNILSFVAMRTAEYSKFIIPIRLNRPGEIFTNPAREKTTMFSFQR